MSLISPWYAATITVATDSQNSAEVDLRGDFESIEIDIPTITSAEIQVKGANESGGTFDLIGLEEPIPTTTGGFRTTISLGGRYQFIKIYTSAVQTSNRTFYVRGISYASGGLVGLLDRIKELLLSAKDTETAVEAINTALQTSGISQVQFAAMVTALQVIDNMISGSEAQVDIVASLPAGTNSIGYITPPSALTDGSKAVTTAGTGVALAASTACKAVLITANASNTGYIYIGGALVSSTVFTKKLLAGEEFSIAIDNLSKIYLDADVSLEGVTFGYVS